MTTDATAGAGALIERAAEAAHAAYFDEPWGSVAEVERQLWRHVVQAVLRVTGGA
jgi:hypothetical protein